MSETKANERPVVDLDRAVIRFAGDSGDGMQLTGDRFTTSSALFGNDLSTLPDFPAEIRPPAGTMAGVSNTHVHNSDYNIVNPGELSPTLVEVNPAALKPGTYTNISGNTALAWGLIAAGQLAQLPLFLGSYPITPASDILHELSKHKNFGVRTLQAEDEIAGIGAALGASYAGSLGITTTSGPGIDLKGETIGLAVNLELPLLVIDIQRGGPATGLPTKTEQADLLQAMFGRHGEAPVPIVAPCTPGDCFFAAIEAARIAIKYRTPVFLLSDGYLANGAEPWPIPDVASLPDISVEFATAPNHADEDGNPEFWPYLRDSETLARPWAIPGTPELTHRIGGLEKADGSGTVSYDAVNHDLMSRLRVATVAGSAKDIPPVEVDDPDQLGGNHAEVLVLGWGSTYGAIAAGVRRVRARGYRVAPAPLRPLNPFPANLGQVLRTYPRILVPEMNLGQLVKLVRADFLVDAKPLSKMRGKPFQAEEIEAAILEMFTGAPSHN